MAQRAEKSDWQSTSIHKAKAGLEKKLPESFDDLGEQGWALHHKMSKEKLSWLAEKLVGAVCKNSPEARNFWKMLQTATEGAYDLADCNTLPKKFALQAATMALWNIPANLELGPAITADNPGMGSDPNTIADTTAPRGRRYTLRSEQFVLIEELAYGDTLSEQVWAKMTAALKTAVKAHEQLIAPTGLLSFPLQEQWEAIGKGKFRRKGTPEQEVAIYHFSGDPGGWDDYEETDWTGIDTSGFIILTGQRAKQHQLQYPK